MPLVIVILVTTMLVGCGTYKGNEIWRRSTCNGIVDFDERARCLEDATQPENEYKREVEDATQG